MPMSMAFLNACADWSERRRVDVTYARAERWTARIILKDAYGAFHGELTPLTPERVANAGHGTVRKRKETADEYAVRVGRALDKLAAHIRAERNRSNRDRLLHHNLAKPCGILSKGFIEALPPQDVIPPQIQTAIDAVRVPVDA